MTDFRHYRNKTGKICFTELIVHREKRRGILISQYSVSEVKTDGKWTVAHTKVSRHQKTTP